MFQHHTNENGVSKNTSNFIGRKGLCHLSSTSKHQAVHSLCLVLSYVPKSGLNARGTKAHVDRASKWRWETSLTSKVRFKERTWPSKPPTTLQEVQSAGFGGAQKLSIICEIDISWNCCESKQSWLKCLGSAHDSKRIQRKTLSTNSFRSLTRGHTHSAGNNLNCFSLGRASLLQPGHRGPKRLLTKHCSHAKFLGDTKAEMQIRTEPQHKITEIHWFTCSLGQEAFYWWTIPTN